LPLDYDTLADGWLGVSPHQNDTENGCHQFHFVVACNLGIGCHWVEACHTWDKLVATTLAVFPGSGGKEKYLLSHSQHIALEKKSQLPIQLIDLNQANLLFNE